MILLRCIAKRAAAVKSCRPDNRLRAKEIIVRKVRTYVPTLIKDAS
jgi:hypothetical protein